MELDDALKARRSIRKYSPQPVEREKIDQCLEAARLAPSACNAQPWKFIIIDDEPLKEIFAREAFSGIFRRTLFAARAPVLVVIVSDPQWLPAAGGAIRKTDFHLIDIGIAGEHFVLKATELGLGTCWIGWFDEAKAKKVLGITGSKKIEILLSVGYPAEDAIITPQRRKPLKDISEYNHGSSH
ncbi:MAG: nitroreductase family protein [Dehalococcoidales bacterium]|jgi:nitroreductase|nr:nitroreductase family protein [Dehalococcoidales bacterium]